MSDSDPTDRFLQRDFTGPPSESFRAALCERTTGVLRRRRRVRLATTVVLLLLCGAALGWSVATLSQPSEPTVQKVIVEVQVPSKEPTPAPPKEKEPAEKRLSPLEEILSPGQLLEVQAHQDATKRAGKLLEAGNRYFEDDDCAAALRCYAEYLSLAGPEALTLAATDNWLLVTLKNSRKKEQIHVE
jgi:hypothetical protein